MNIIQIAGHLGADPETRFTPTGQKVTTLRVAANTRKAGKEETVWWRVTVWGDRFDKLMPYLKKGSAIIVVGEMSKPEIYTDKEGRPQISLELTAELIRFSPFGRSDRSSQEGSSQGASTGGYDDGFGESSYGASGQGQRSGQRYAPAQGFQSSQPALGEEPIPF